MAQEAAAETGEEDPAQLLTERLERFFRNSPYFAEVGWTRIDDYPPVAIFIQDPPRKDERHYAREARVFGPWIQKLVEIFERDYVVPNRLEANGLLGFLPLMILPTQGSYDDFGRASRSAGLRFTRAFYDPSIPLAITYRDRFGSTAAYRERNPALHEVTHALFHSYHIDKAGLPRVVWLNEGLADYLTFHVGREPEALEDHFLDREALRTADFVLSNANIEPSFLKLSTLVGLGSYAEVIEAGHKALDSAGSAMQDQLLLTHFYAHSYLMVHYLHQAHDGRYRDRIVDYVGRVLRGEQGDSAFFAAFEGLDLEDLDHDFRAWAKETSWDELGYGRNGAAVEIDGATATNASAKASTLTGVFAAEPGHWSALGVGEEEPEGLLALAVFRASEGRVREASAVLERLAGSTLEAALAARVGLEQQRVRDWIELRDTWLEALASKGTKVRIGPKGNRVEGKVRSVEDGTLVLSARAGGDIRIELETLAPETLADAMGKRAQDFAPKHVRLWAYAVCGNSKVASLMRSAKDEPTLRIKRDAEEFYGPIEELGRTVALLEDLAQAGPPLDDEAAKEQWLQLRELLPAQLKRPTVDRRLASLRHVAGAALALSFEGMGTLSQLTPGVADQLPDGTLVLRYDFEEDRELEDFRSPGAGLTPSEDDLPLLGQDHSNALVLRQGVLRGSGRAALVHEFDWTTPLRVKARARLRRPSYSGSYHSQFGFALCSRGPLAQVLGKLHAGGFQLFTRDTQRRGADQAIVHQELGFDTWHDLELVHDGSSVTLIVDGQERGQVDAFGLTSGPLALWIGSDLTVEVDSLRIEGHPSPESLLAVGRDWVEGQMEALGL